MCRACLLFAAPLSILVGYATKNTDQYFTLGAITFDPLTTAIDLQDIKPVFPENTELDEMDGQFTLQTFDAGAAMAKKWWYLVEGGEEECEDGTGWYPNFECEEKASYTFKQGEGFMFSSAFPDKSGAGYTIAGQVAKGETTIPVNQYFTLIGNIRPAEVSLQALVPVFPEGTALDEMDGQFTLQTFDAGAAMAKKWWYLVEGGEEECEDGTGWYPNFECEEKAEYTFKPGEGFMFSSSFEDIDQYEEGKGAALKFPAIIAE